MIKLACKNTKISKRSYNGECTEESMDKERHWADAGSEVQGVAGVGEQCVEWEGRQPDGPQHQGGGRERLRRNPHLRIA